MTDKLKLCPFCGGKAKIEWEAWTEFRYPYGVYQLTVRHKPECFFVQMNGMNNKSEMIANDEKTLIETWNKRAGEQE